MCVFAVATHFCMYAFLLRRHMCIILIKFLQNLHHTTAHHSGGHKNAINSKWNFCCQSKCESKYQASKCFMSVLPTHTHTHTLTHRRMDGAKAADLWVPSVVSPIYIVFVRVSVNCFVFFFLLFILHLFVVFHFHRFVVPLFCCFPF